ncbi:MAG: hypothetical protein US24_C0043G0005 [candidate division WS6 bacterium GW2011_GWC2_36_7]|uniref:Uncharacterized protein n=1 Tax=candidate division WS6 bacterium GW2011_GWC2_36_7 TaxID=1619091 RepID=A0A0G0FC84_9BACT|nr:MAG: hypothetical protein US14_C0011G0012 [candidate division WS6 bacterium GW2011_WS6_36_26]KKQ11085.1 MAG: hypothetical protein US24_C0043G0005 [candidate division WS6 bacterium GW2011_GWC2_36_7]
MNKTMKVVRWPLLIVCIAGMVIGAFFMMTPSTTRIYSEKIAFCNDGLCQISSLQRYSNGSAAGSSSNGVSTEWVDEWMKSE